MAGELNGHSVGVAVDGDNNGTYSNLGGVTENSFTLNNTPIEIQSKSTSQWRRLLTEQGLQNVDMSVTVVYSDNNVANVMRSYAKNKTKGPDFQIDRGGQIMQGKFMVQNYQETAPDNDKVTATFNLVSTDTVIGI